jgi:MoxR-like ATPase
MKVTKTISKEVLDNVFVTALEGGSNYWASVSNETIVLIREAVPSSKNPYFASAMLEAITEHNVEVPINDCEDEDEVLGVISLATMNERLQKLAESDDAWALDDMLDEDFDATTADVVFQYIVMGEVVFG